jgi:hypothetical protein
MPHAVQTLAAVVAHCRRHCHSGVSLGYHQCCFDVLRIAEPNGPRPMPTPEQKRMRPPRTRPLDRQPHDPTPEHIAAACDAIRATWPIERLRRNERYAPAEAHEAKAADLGIRPDLRP